MAAAWIWRSGQRGGFDDLAFGHNLIAVGWHQVGDLTPYPDLDQIRTQVSTAFPTSPAGSVESRAFQLYAFRTLIAEGDLVVVLSTRTTEIAIGTVSGPYQHRADHPAATSHVREVTWLRQRVARVDVGEDLLTSPALTALFRLQPHTDALKRLGAIVTDGVDPALGRGPSPTAPPVAVADTGSPPFRRLRQNLAHARNLARAGETLSTTDASLVGDVFRAAWVQGCAALDHWVRQEVSYRLQFLARSPGSEPLGYSRLRISVAELERVIRRRDDLSQVLEDAVRKHNSTRAFLGPGPIEQAFQLVTALREGELWARVATVLNDDATGGAAPHTDGGVTRRLREISARRNRIAHEYDEDPAHEGQKLPITEVEVLSMIDWIEQLATAISDVLPAPSPGDA